MRVHQAQVLALFCTLSGCLEGSDSDPRDDDGGGKGDDPFATDEASIYAVGNRLQPWQGEDAFLDDVQSVFARRCVTCHSCGDAPCQLKLSSFEGLLRGSNDDDLYAARVFSIDDAYDPAHLDHGRARDLSSGLVDYEATEAKWRDADFYSVTAHDTDSVLARVLTEARDVTTSFDQSFEVAKSLEGRTFACVQDDSPDGATMVGRAMPLGLPGLPDEATDAVLAWLEDGAASLSDEAQRGVGDPLDADAVAEWEAFFNPEDTERNRVVARYLYEHMFFADLHLERSPGEFYRLVRSRTRTGPIDQIVTELPSDSAGKGPVFYRLMKQTQVLAAKQHIAWEIDDDTMQRWRELFFGDWQLVDNPEFDPKSNNPFAYFAQIPPEVRYRFMIEHSRELVDAMVRGSVCVGTGATFAIRDRFWVWFLDPSADPSALESVAGETTHGPLLGESSWFHLDPRQADTLREIDYLRAYRRNLQQLRPDGLAVEDLWDGNGGKEPDAWLTVTRHGTSASVETGPRQGLPETIWVLGYSNFERLYYDLVVNFKAWGHIKHKLETWGLMSLVRSEGEDLFLAMLPPDVREDMRAHKTRGWGQFNDLLLPNYATCSKELTQIVDDCKAYPTAVEYDVPLVLKGTARFDAYLTDVSQLVREHIGGAMLEADALNQPGAGDIPSRITSREDVDAAFDHLTGWTHKGWEHMPELTTVRVHGEGFSWLYTIAANRIYTSHDRVYFEGITRVPGEDTLSVTRGIHGARPQLFVDLELDAVGTFVQRLAAVEDAAGFAKLVGTHAEPTDGIHIIDRRDDAFWTFLDAVHDQWFSEDPVDAAILDVSEYLWPQQL